MDAVHKPGTIGTIVEGKFFFASEECNLRKITVQAEVGNCIRILS